MNKDYNIEGSGEVQYQVLKAICGDTTNKSMVDIGCGFCPTTRRLGFTDKTYVDIVVRDLGEENEYFKQMDILQMIKLKSKNKIDVTISLDNLEHFWEKDAIRLIKWMDKNSETKIIFTPLGHYMTIDDKENIDPDTHKSGFTPQQFNDLGWHTLTFHNFHPTLNLGTFFAWKCDNTEQTFDNVINQLNFN
jgi:hypothetical protein